MPETGPKHYFQEERSVAEVKWELLGKCLGVWSSSHLALYPPDANVPLHFIDLNAAEGYHTDALNDPIPCNWLALFRNTVKTPRLQQSVRFYLGYPMKQPLENLQAQLAETNAYELLSEPPILLHSRENRDLLEAALAAQEAAFIYMDPFRSGYAQKMLLQSGDTARQTEMLLHFTPDGIRKALGGKKTGKALAAFFGERMRRIKAYCGREKDNARRAQFMAQHLESLLLEKGLNPLFFPIYKPGTGVVSQYLIFASPQSARYTCFKHLILPYTDYQQDGVPLLAANHGHDPQLALFSHRPAFSLELLASDLACGASRFKFKAVEKVYELHSPNTPYTPDNYLVAYERLRDAGRVELLNGKTMQTVRKVTYTSVVKYLS
ncbi:hypothetical protein MKJ04_09270 [Pontibacter sp. E15-1]|uniref:hypothetical protein n=1 Tax=Pontibacter sp. E15-1 TaxID=2919918 RepID=UPI001F4FA9E1|nr:hypothetical protein [Pontibacter sp. E15-1]MCJ8165032.1 hypothetical protein [Pontibacter sp. E15-1]